MFLITLSSYFSDVSAKRLRNLTASISNVIPVRVDLDKVFENTPLQKFFNKKRLAKFSNYGGNLLNLGVFIAYDANYTCVVRIPYN